MADVPKYPAGALAVMNGIAPLFSFVVLGCGTYFWLKGRPFKRSSWPRYFLTWVAILNLPYLGPQMMGMGGPSLPNGSGNDFATVFSYFGASQFLRAWLVVLGFVLFIFLQAPLRDLLYLEDRAAESGGYKSASRLRMILGWGFVVLGLADSLVVCQIQLHSHGTILLLFEPVFWALACISFVSWRSDLTRALCRQWLAPCIVSTLVLVPLGGDFLLLWLFVIPIVLGAIYFRTSSERRAERRPAMA